MSAMHTHLLRGLAILGTVFLLQSPACALEDTAGAETADNAPLYSGGIGDDEISYIKSVQNQYDVKVLFTEANGMFLSDLPVTVMDKNGQAVVSTVTKGPVLLLNLPQGSYTLTATQGETSREQKISVAGKKGLHTYQLRFPTRDVLSSEGN